MREYFNAEREMNQTFSEMSWASIWNVMGEESECLINSVVSWCFLTAVFKPEELRQALMPTLEALYRQDPESLPFRQPVDPQLLGIPVSYNFASVSHKYPCFIS